MKQIIKLLVDKGDFLEVHEHFAENILVGFARIDGKAIGFIANQPMYLAGALDINSSTKAGFASFAFAIVSTSQLLLSLIPLATCQGQIRNIMV